MNVPMNDDHLTKTNILAHCFDRVPGWVFFCVFWGGGGDDIELNKF